MYRFKIGSLFDGSGGFPLAASLCGGVPTWASEVEPYPIAVTKSRFPQMVHLGSVTDVKGGEIEPVDVITFGSPCQDLSVAGKRAGLKHEVNGDEETTRSGLFMEAVRIIKEMREATNGVYPAFAVWENVPGAFSSNGGEDFRTVLEELIRIVEPTAAVPSVPKAGWAYADVYRGDGWSIAYRVLDAQYWGVPQRRRRIYLVLDLRGERAGEVLFKRESLRGNFAESGTPWKSASGNAERGSGAADREGEERLHLGWCCENREHSGDVGADGRGENDPRSDSVDRRGLQVLGITECGRERDLVAFHLLQDPIPNSKGAPCMGQGNSIPSVCVKCYESHPMDSRIKELEDDVSPTVSVKWHKGAADTPLVVCCIDGDKIGKAERSGGSGLGIRPGDAMYTLTAKDAGTHAVAVQTYQKVTGPLMANSHPGSYTGQDAFSDMLVAGKVVGASQNTGTVRVRYIVRRLTPTECARLQGFPDHWGHPDQKTEFTDAEYRFWQDVRNTHAAINGKQTKEYTKDQMLTWYNKLHTDSSEYKMWGNGIALPCALYVMQGIGDCFEC